MLFNLPPIREKSSSKPKKVEKKFRDPLLAPCNQGKKQFSRDSPSAHASLLQPEMPSLLPMSAVLEKRLASKNVFEHLPDYRTRISPFADDRNHRIVAWQGKSFVRLHAPVPFVRLHAPAGNLPVHLVFQTSLQSSIMTIFRKKKVPRLLFPGKRLYYWILFLWGSSSVG